MNVGTLTGTIRIEDQASHVIDIISHRVENFAAGLSTNLKLAAFGAGAVVTAIGGVVGAITALGVKGSVIQGVEDSFHSLATSIGQDGTAMFNAINDGVKGTVDGVQLMKATSVAMAAGVKLTTADMKTLGEAGRAMGRAMGTDASQGVETLSQALVRGNARTLARLGIQINVEQAERKYAAAIGVTRDQLNEAGKVEARRAAIFDAMRTYVDRAGVSQLTFKERIQQVQVAIGNWFDDLSKAVAKSSAVAGAFDAIKTAIANAFGSSGQKSIDIIVHGIDSFANGVTKIAPYITLAIDSVKSFWQWLNDLNDRFHITDTLTSVVTSAFAFLRGAFNFVRDAARETMAAWDKMPVWMQTMAADAVKVGAGLYVIGKATGAANSSLTGLVGPFDTLINLMANWKVLAGGFGLTTINLALKWKQLGDVWIYFNTLFKMNGIVFAIRTFAASIVELAIPAIAAFLATPVGIALLVITFVTSIYKIIGALKALAEWKGTTWEFFTQKDEDNWVRRLGNLAGRLVGIKILLGSMQKTQEIAARSPGPVMDPRGLPKIIETPQSVLSSMAPLNKPKGDFIKDDMRDRVEALMKSYRDAGKDLDAFAAGFRNLSKEQLADYDVQQMLIPQIEKMVEAHRALTPAMQQEYTTALAMKLSYEDLQISRLNDQNVTLESIDIQKQQGLSLQNIATLYDVTTEALSRKIAMDERDNAYMETSIQLQDNLRAAKNANQLEGLALQLKTLHMSEEAEIHSYEKMKEAGKINETQLGEFRLLIIQTYAEKAVAAQKQEMDKRAAAIVSGQQAIYAAENEYADLIDSLTLTSTDYQLAHIQRETEEKKKLYAIQHAGSLEQIKAYNAAVDALAQARKEDLYVDSRALIDNSRATLQQIADRNYNTWKEMEKDPANYSKAAIRHQKQIYLASQDYANGVKMSWRIAWEDMKTAMDRALSGLANDLTSVIEGKMSLGKAAANFGTQIAEEFTAEILKSIPIIGESLSKLAKPIIAGIKKLLSGLFDIGTEGRDAVQKYVDSQGGYEKIHTKLLELGRAGEQLWINLTQGVGRNNPEQAAAAVASVTAALETTPSSMAAAAGYKTKAELQLLADNAKKVFDYMVSTGTYSAEQIQQAFQNAADAYDAAEGGGANIAAAAGYQTLDQLQVVADKAKAVYDYMVASGRYSASAIADAFQKSKDAQIAALGEVGQAAADSIKKLEDQMKPLQDLIANEAPEEFMGSMEEAARAQLKTLEVQKAAAQQAMDEELAKRKETTAASNDNAADQALDLQARLNIIFAANPIRVPYYYAPLNSPGVAPPVAPGNYTPPTHDSEPQTYAAGGIVPSYYGQGTTNVVQFRAKGTDTVPAMLTPGEQVLTVPQARAYEASSTMHKAPEPMVPTVVFERGAFEGMVVDSEERIGYLAEEIFKKVSKGGKLQTSARAAIKVA